MVVGGKQAPLAVVKAGGREPEDHHLHHRPRLLHLHPPRRRLRPTLPRDRCGTIWSPEWRVRKCGSTSPSTTHRRRPCSRHLRIVHLRHLRRLRRPRTHLYPHETRAHPHRCRTTRWCPSPPSSRGYSLSPRWLRCFKRRVVEKVAVSSSRR